MHPIRWIALAVVATVGVACSSGTEVTTEADTTDAAGDVRDSERTSVPDTADDTVADTTADTAASASDDTRPDAPASTTTSAATTVATTAAPQEATIGSTITLSGYDDERVAVTVTAFADPAPPTEFAEPDPGNRLVGVQVRLVNVADSPWRDSPSNGARLIDAAFSQHDASWQPTSLGADIGSPTIAPGDTRLGWLTFELPVDVAADRFTLSLNSGFADQTREWQLTAGAPFDPAPPVLVPDAGPRRTITLEGYDDEQVAVTLSAVADPAPPGEYSRPDDGWRFVGVQLTLANTGDVPYDDSPTNGITAVDTFGQTWTPSVYDSAVGPGFEGGSVTLAPGDRRVGWVVFEVPAVLPLTKITMALNSGFADQVGEWRLG